MIVRALPIEKDWTGQPPFRSYRYLSKLKSFVMAQPAAEPYVSEGSSATSKTESDPMVSRLYKTIEILDELIFTWVKSNSSQQPPIFSYSFSLDKPASTESTSLLPTSEELLWTLFACAHDQSFEDGIVSPFAAELERRVFMLGSDVVLDLAAILFDKNTNAEVAAEVLKTMGRIEHIDTHQVRRWLLEKALTNSSPRIRDAAAIGLASMDDPASLTAIKAAIEQEHYPELRNDLCQICYQLARKR